MRDINSINVLYTLLLSPQPIAGTAFVPRDIAAGEAIARRACEPAAPDVSQSSIISDVCNQTLASDFSTCSDQMTVNMQQSATNTCGQYFGLFADCLMANDGDHTACSDSFFGYQDCNNYTMQAYAYCGCYYTLPASLADCADQQLQPQPQGTAIVPTTSVPVAAIPTAPEGLASAAGADEEPTPTILTVSGAATSPSSQSAITLSDPQPSSSPTIRINPLESAMSSSDLGPARTPTAAMSTTTELITVVVTHATTLTAAGYTTTATLTSASMSTVYACADGGDVSALAAPVPTPSASKSVSTAPTPLAPAPIDPETSAPHSAAVPVQSTGASTAEGKTKQIGSQNTSTPHTMTKPVQSTGARIANGTTSSWGSQETFAPPSVMAPAQSTGVGAPEGTGGRNGSAVCTRCKRRSKMF